MIGPAGSLDPILARALIAWYESGGNQNGPGDPLNEIALARNQEWVTALDSGANNVLGSMTTPDSHLLLKFY